MANNDLVKKKTIALTPEVHADLMRVVAAIQAKIGVNTTANDAVAALLDGWNVLKKCEELNKAEQENPTSSGSHMGLEVTYCVKHLDGKPIIYKVEEWEREGSTWEPLNKTP